MNSSSEEDGNFSFLEDVVLAILAVYSYPLELAEKCRDAMRSANLFDYRKLAASSLAALTDELKAANYNRGDLTWQYADRLIALGQHVLQCDPDELQRQLRVGDVEDVRKALLPIYGVGPKVIENFLELRRRRQQQPVVATSRE